MKLVKVGAAILNQTPLAWENNKSNILGAIRAAKSQNVSILCLPELCVSGYGCEDAFHSPGLHQTAQQVLREIVPETGGIVVSVGLGMLYRNGLFDTACLLADGKILGFAAKQHLAGDGLHYEPRWFKPWPSGVCAEVVFDGDSYPLGDLSFEVGRIKIGFEICEDAWVAKRPGGVLSEHGVDIILNPSASHFAFGKYEVRKRFVLEGSRAFGVTYVYSNLIGNEAGRVIYDGGALIASGGELTAAGPRFSFAPFEVTSCIVDVEATRMNQARLGSFEPDPTPDENCLRCDFDFPKARPQRRDPQTPAWASGATVKEEEFTRAITLALFDYMRKSRASGFVVSLSGGADSSTAACLVAMMVGFGCDALGVSEFKKRIGLADAEASGVPELVHMILTCVYQATENSSETTRNAARELSAAVNAQFIELDVNDLVKGYVGMIENAIGRRLSWETDDLALQNIQARVRAPGVWLLTNLRNALLLTTSNRSEAAVGYATMDGDTCGGLSPLAGIDKAFLRQWLRWLEKQGPADVGPIPVLHLVNAQAPTAELQPPEANQTDEEDLMPYELLDAIERAAIGDKKTPVECFQLLRVRFDQYSDQQLVAWVSRFFRLWCRNQWKRERYAPSLHVDDKNLDPKTWCRFPILSGGFERELAALREQLGKP